MVSGIFHQGSGLGNQLHRYVATRVLARDKGYDFSMVVPDNFKGKDFMKLDMGKNSIFTYHTEITTGKVVVGCEMPLWEEGTNYYNPEFNFIEDNTIIDGEFQDERYFEHHLKDVDKWLSVEPLNVPDNVCIINFRGGEYSVFPDLFLTPDYWHKAIEKMIEKMDIFRFMKGIDKKDFEIKFEVHTDDPELAKKFFPTFPVIHDMALNWRTLRYARHAIISNSSFAILPRLLSGGTTIAPRYWARHNTKVWSTPQNYYKSFTYL